MELDTRQGEGFSFPPPYEDQLWGWDSLLLIQWVLTFLPPGIKQPECEADYSHLPSDIV